MSALSFVLLRDRSMEFVDSHMHIWDVVGGPHDLGTLGGPAEKFPNYSMAVC